MQLACQKPSRPRADPTNPDDATAYFNQPLACAGRRRMRIVAFTSACCANLHNRPSSTQVFGASTMTRTRMLVLGLLAGCVASLAAQGLDPSAARPPVAKRVPHKMTAHGDPRVDDY